MKFDLNAKAGPEHWVTVTFVIIGLIVLFNRITGSTTPPIGSQTGVDVTAMVVLGG